MFHHPPPLQKYWHNTADGVQDRTVTGVATYFARLAKQFDELNPTGTHPTHKPTKHSSNPTPKPTQPTTLYAYNNPKIESWDHDTMRPWDLETLPNPITGFQENPFRHEFYQELYIIRVLLIRLLLYTYRSVQLWYSSCIRAIYIYSAVTTRASQENTRFS